VTGSFNTPVLIPTMKSCRKLDCTGPSWKQFGLEKYILAEPGTNKTKTSPRTARTRVDPTRWAYFDVYFFDYYKPPSLVLHIIVADYHTKPSWVCVLFRQYLFWNIYELTAKDSCFSFDYSSHFYLSALTDDSCCNCKVVVLSASGAASVAPHRQ
jgi:hypothetical protein